MNPRLVIGCMTGTSIDAIDAAMVTIEGRGLDMSARFERGTSRSLGTLAPRLRALAEQTPMSAGEIADLMREFSLAHAEVVRELLHATSATTGDVRPDLICVHGQTVFHKPPLTWQMFNPWPLVREIGTPVVFDLRGADAAFGGQGAPITPLADWVLFRPREAHGEGGRVRAIVNLGGFCNATTLCTPGKMRAPGGTSVEAGGPEFVRGFDVCACNLLLDEVARRVLYTAYDQDGQAALRGEPNADAVEDLLSLLEGQTGGAGAARSLGTGDEASEWIARWRGPVSPDDLAASACEGIGRAIGRRLLGQREIYVAGGGARNRALVRAIEGWCSGRVRTLDDLGVPIEYREAAEFGVLGALCADGVAITLPAVTGVSSPAPIGGCWAGRY